MLSLLWYLFTVSCCNSCSYVYLVIESVFLPVYLTCLQVIFPIFLHPESTPTVTHTLMLLTTTPKLSGWSMVEWEILQLDFHMHYRWVTTPHIFYVLGNRLTSYSIDSRNWASYMSVKSLRDSNKFCLANSFSPL